MLTVQPGPRDRRLLSALLILGVVAVTFYIVQPADRPVLLLRRHPPHLLPGLAARVHHQPDRRPASSMPSRACRGRWRRSSSTARSWSSWWSSSSWPPGPWRRSIADFATQLPTSRRTCPRSSRRGRPGSNSIGLGQVDLVAQAEAALGNLDQIAGALVAPLQQIAVASLSVVGTMLIVFFLSIYMVLDRDAVLAFLFRIVPPSYSEEARLLETSVSRSFGGFLRGQALMGFVYFLIALGTNAAARTAAGRPDVGRRGPAPDDPVLRPVRVVGAAGHRRARPQARRGRPDAHPDGRRLGRRHERPPAADHAGRGRDPPDRRPRLGAHRRPDRRHPRRHLRDPVRRRRVRVRHGVPAPDLGRPVGRRPRRQTARGTRRPPGPHPARADARQRDRHRRAGPAGATDLAEPDQASAPT